MSIEGSIESRFSTKNLVIIESSASITPVSQFVKSDAARVLERLCIIERRRGRLRAVPLLYLIRRAHLIRALYWSPSLLEPFIAICVIYDRRWGRLLPSLLLYTKTELLCIICVTQQTTSDNRRRTGAY